MRTLCGAALLILLAGCSSGRYYAHPDQMVAVPAAKPAAQPSVRCTAASAQVAGNGRGDTLFVHPGMLSLSAHWDHGLAAASGQLLVRDGYAERLVELDGRDPASMEQTMATDQIGSATSRERVCQYV